MTTSKQGRTESNHVRWLWRPTAHPGARPYCTQDCGCFGGTLLSQEHVLDDQSVQRESNPRVHLGKVAGCRYITDARDRASQRSHELPDLNRLLHLRKMALKPISKFVRCVRRARSPVPATGVEPVPPVLQTGARPLELHRNRSHYPRQESDLVFDLRRIACCRHTPGMFFQYPSLELNQDLHLRRVA